MLINKTGKEIDFNLKDVQLKVKNCLVDETLADVYFGFNSISNKRWVALAKEIFHFDNCVKQESDYEILFFKEVSKEEGNSIYAEIKKNKKITKELRMHYDCTKLTAF